MAYFKIDQKEWGRKHEEQFNLMHAVLLVSRERFNGTCSIPMDRITSKNILESDP